MRSIKIVNILGYGMGLLGTSLSFLPFNIKRKLSKLSYYKINNDTIRFFIFHFFDSLLKNNKKDLYVTKDFTIVDGKRLNYKLRLNLKSYVNRNNFYKSPCTDLGFLMAKLLDKNDIYVDVGANIGNTSLMGACFAKKVIAFEPVPEMITYFKQNLLLNQDKNIELHEFALSNVTAIKKIMLSYNDGANTFNDKFADSNPKDEYYASIKVLVKKFDNLNLGKVDFIKIDVEGHELAVLEGMKKTIKDVKYVICETSPLYYKKVKLFFKNNYFEQIKKYGDHDNELTNLFFVNKNKVSDINQVRSLVSKNL